MLNIEEIKGLIPQRYPFLMLDRVVEIKEGEYIKAYKNISIDEECFKGHFPDTPVFPGAFTPQEVYQAHNAGATMVKVFPAKLFGPEYLRELKGPFNDIELLACSGVTPDNLKDYFANGASAVSFGASVFRKDWLAKGDFQAIAHAVKKFVDAWEIK